MPPYVGMARKQNGGYNASISVQNADISPVGTTFHRSVERGSTMNESKLLETTCSSRT